MKTAPDAVRKPHPCRSTSRRKIWAIWRGSSGCETLLLQKAVADGIDTRERRIACRRDHVCIPRHGVVADHITHVAHEPGLVVNETLAADISSQRHEQDRTGGEIFFATLSRT